MGRDGEWRERRETEDRGADSSVERDRVDKSMRGCGVHDFLFHDVADWGSGREQRGR